MRYALYHLLDFYSILIVVWCFMSWVPRREGSLLTDVAEVLDRLVSPYTSLFRKHIPPMGGIDWSPMIALIVLQFVQRLILRF